MRHLARTPTWGRGNIRLVSETTTIFLKKVRYPTGKVRYPTLAPIKTVRLMLSAWRQELYWKGNGSATAAETVSSLCVVFTS